MSTYVKLATEAGDQFLAALAESQDQFLKYLKASSAWTPAPTTPAAPPFSDEYFPTPREIYEANFAFMSKLLKQQKAFTDKLFSTTTSAS